MKQYLDQIKAWIAAKGGFTHVVAGAITTATALYLGVPHFKLLADSAWVALPQAAKHVALAAVGIYAFYHNSSK